jgi:hypothetical protein
LCLSPFHPLRLHYIILIDRIQYHYQYQNIRRILMYIYYLIYL